MDKIKKLKEIIDESKNIVVLTGAGVSTDSGISDFRGENGIENKYSIPMEILLSHEYFYSHTDDFYKNYKEIFNCSNIKPNITHKYLYELEKMGKLKAIVTQNIDGLHSKAGNKLVYEIHGTILSNHCIKCNKKYNEVKVFTSKGIPACDCGGIIKPDVVLYGESLPMDTLNNAIKKIKEADLLLVLGTSLVVYPAAGLIDYFSGDNLVIINKDKTSYDRYANLVINDNLSEVFSHLIDRGKL